MRYKFSRISIHDINIVAVSQNCSKNLHQKDSLNLSISIESLKLKVR